MKATIFDMDGVLVDSEPLWRLAEKQAFAEVGLVLSDADCELTMGKRTDEVIEYWLARSPAINASASEIERRLTSLMRKLIAERGAALPGLAHALNLVRGAGQALALASSSPLELIRAVLQSLGLNDSFDAVQSAESETAGKPDPAVFLSTARALGVSPEACTVIEDSAAGVQAGLAAGMRVIAVPPPHLFADPSYDTACVKLRSLEELTEEMLT